MCESDIFGIGLQMRSIGVSLNSIQKYFIKSQANIVTYSNSIFHNLPGGVMEVTVCICLYLDC